MPFAAVHSTVADTLRAFAEVRERLRDKWQGPIDLALLFFSPHHRAKARELAAAAFEGLQPRTLLGCPGEAIIANEQEIEDGPALCLWAGRWKEPVELTPFHLVLEYTPDGQSLLGWPDALVGQEAKGAIALTLGDPFTFPTDEYLRQVNEDCPGLRVLGGMGSGARSPGQIPLLVNDQVHHEGAVGVVLQGPVKARAVVSQGCRPIGRPLVVTKAEENMIQEVGGQTPLAYLQSLWRELAPADQALFQQGLHIGRVLNEYQGEFHRGDFLVRNVLGLHRDTGALAITDHVRVGQTVQFHVRDAATADDDLHQLLQMDMNGHTSPPAGALLFSCNGRGSRLFTKPHHDARVLREEAGPIPVAGFFAQGELGPVGGQNFIHGFTASVVLFEE